MSSWDDLKLVLSIVDNGGITGAARELNVHHATVLRRLDAFEHRMGLVLFDRKKTGYLPTLIGGSIAERARSISTDVEETYRRMAGEDLRLSGVLRIATSDFLAQTYLPNILQLYKERHPNVDIELAISTEQVSLSKRDADVAIRLSQTPLNTFSGEAIAQVDYAVYGAPDFAEKHPTPEQGAWVVDDHSLSHTAVHNWWLQHFHNAPVSLRVNSTMARAEAVKAGMGMGFLPMILAQNNSDFSLIQHKKEWQLDVWFLTHPDLYRMPRVQALKRVASELFQQAR